MTIFKILPYRPFSELTEFVACINENGYTEKIENTRLGYTLVINPFGYLSKTGILICQYLNNFSLSGLNILDVGTGETALLTVHSAILGANKVVAIDVDDSILKWAQNNVNINGLNNKTTLEKISLHEYENNFKFDMIISNPPQMPVKNFHSLHDDGGKDGKYNIKGLIKLAKQHLKNGGNLIFTAFDFLGVDKSYNNQPSLYELLRKHSFSSKIVKEAIKEIKPDSYTAKNMGWIKMIYPNYIFHKNKNGLYWYKIFVISARKAK